MGAHTELNHFQPGRKQIHLLNAPTVIKKLIDNQISEWPCISTGYSMWWPP